jgi:RNA polymerase sigma factor (sigma-70 family)
VEKDAVSVTMPMPPLGAPDRALPGTDADLLTRFVRTGDELAFTELVERHGPMVLGVCRRALGCHHDAEDAFQATFLILARKASTIRSPECLASWLYGVAHRTATKMREQRRRQQEAEGQAGGEPTATAAPLGLAWREVQQALDEEITQLDEKYRAPLVLCYLEGKSHEEAAHTLGRPLGSISWLLNRALGELRERLGNRGMTLMGGMPLLMLALQGPIPVPGALIAGTLRALAAGTVGRLAALIDAILREMAGEATSPLNRVLTGLLLGLTLSLAGYAALSTRLSASSARPGDPPAAAQPCGGKCGATP